MKSRVIWLGIEAFNLTFSEIRYGEGHCQYRLDYVNRFLLDISLRHNLSKLTHSELYLHFSGKVFCSRLPNESIKNPGILKDPIHRQMPPLGHQRHRGLGDPVF
jgi:hypothetical protein